MKGKTVSIKKKNNKLNDGFLAKEMNVLTLVVLNTVPARAGSERTRSNMSLGRFLQLEAAALKCLLWKRGERLVYSVYIGICLFRIFIAIHGALILLLKRVEEISTQRLQGLVYVS